MSRTRTRKPTLEPDGWYSTHTGDFFRAFGDAGIVIATINKHGWWWVRSVGKRTPIAFETTNRPIAQAKTLALAAVCAYVTNILKDAKPAIVQLARDVEHAAECEILDCPRCAAVATEDDVVHRLACVLLDA